MNFYKKLLEKNISDITPTSEDPTSISEPLTSTPQRQDKTSVADLSKTPTKSSKSNRRGKNKSLKKKEVAKCYVLDADSTINVDVEQHDTLDRTTQQQLPYYKDETYYFMKEMIQKKMNGVGSIALSWSGVLLCGLPGTGKNALLTELSLELGLNLVTASILGWSRSNSRTYAQECLDRAIKCAPSILLFDELDCLCHPQAKKEDNFSKVISKIIEKTKSLDAFVLPVGATSRPESVPDVLRASGRLDRRVVLPLPSIEQRTLILGQLLSHNADIDADDLKKVAREARGFAAADLAAAVRFAWQLTIGDNRVQCENDLSNFCNLRLGSEALRLAVRGVVPSYLRNNDAVVSKVEWSDIYGYDSIKDKLKKSVEMREDGSYSLRGVLLYGPPGCSKTMLVRALATETRFSYFPIKCSDLLSKYVGETERRLSGVFERALRSAPSIIFMDEMDSLCGERGGGDGASGVVPEMLSLMRGCLEQGNILAIGATNRPQVIDEALLSPGCLEVLLHVSLPDCFSRCSVWQGMLQDVPSESVDVVQLCQKTEGFSCAEICSVYQRAAHSLLSSCVNGDTVETSLDSVLMTQHLLERSAASMAPRTSQKMLSAVQSFIAARTGQAR